MSGPSRVGVVGCGAIAFEHLAFLGPSPLTSLVAVCDTSAASARFAAERYGAGSWFTSLDEMLEQTAPEVVHVLTPPHTHAGIAARCASAGAHVICEKPIAPTTAALDEMLAVAASADRRLMESQNLRYNDPVLEIRAAATAGDLGDVREVDVMLSLDLVSSRFGDLNLSGPGADLPGGAVHDFLPHLAYLFLLMADQPVDDVTGRLRNASGNPRIGFDQLDALIVAGRVRGRLRVACDLAPDAFRLCVRGTKASIETDLYHPYRRVEGGANTGKRIAVEHLVSGARLPWSGVTELADKVRQFGTYHGMSRMLEAYYQALAAGAPQPVSVDDMRASADLVDRLVALQVAS